MGSSHGLVHLFQLHSFVSSQCAISRKGPAQLSGSGSTPTSALLTPAGVTPQRGCVQVMEQGHTWIHTENPRSENLPTPSNRQGAQGPWQCQRSPILLQNMRIYTLDLMSSEVFSNLNDSVVYISATRSQLCSKHHPPCSNYPPGMGESQESVSKQSTLQEQNPTGKPGLVSQNHILGVVLMAKSARQAFNP